MFEERVRRVVPRWRSSKVAARTPEARTTPPKVKVDLTFEVEQKRREFERHQSVPVASELMFVASAAGNHEAARTAAQLILEQASSIGATQLVQSAKRVLEGDTQASLASSKDFVAIARKQLAMDFRNPILLMDVARELTASGHEKSAGRYVKAAVALAPRSRFVVRTAARFYLHCDKKERAHDLLRQSSLVRTDPWVMASEIAVATVRGRVSSFASKAAASLLGRTSGSADVSELASAAATVELLSGSEKKAKALFRMSLREPNDNSVAQVEWAATRLKLVVDDSALETPFSFEANSNNAYRRLQIEAAIEHAKQWALDEPFASRPRDTLCYLYCVDGQYHLALAAAKDLIRVDGGSLGAKLNLLFVQIATGQLENAYEDLLKLSRHSDAKRKAPHLFANAGALAFATGDNALGKDFYQRAIKAAKVRNEASTEALARAFFARTASQMGDAEAKRISDDASTSVMRLPSPGAIHVVRALVDDKTSQKLEATATARVATKKWSWDAATNTLWSLE